MPLSNKVEKDVLFLFTSTCWCKNNASLIGLAFLTHANTLLVCSGCRQVLQHFMMDYTASIECVVKVYMEWVWGRRGRGDTWIIARTLGIKFIFYPDRPSVSPCRIWPGLLISICMEASSLSPEGVKGERGVLWFKRRHLSHLLGHPKGQPCEGERRGREGENSINMCGLSSKVWSRSCDCRGEDIANARLYHFD